MYYCSLLVLVLMNSKYDSSTPHAVCAVGSRSTGAARGARAHPDAAARVVRVAAGALAALRVAHGRPTAVRERRRRRAASGERHSLAARAARTRTRQRVARGALRTRVGPGAGPAAARPAHCDRALRVRRARTRDARDARTPHALQWRARGALPERAGAGLSLVRFDPILILPEILENRSCVHTVVNHSVTLQYIRVLRALHLMMASDLSRQPHQSSCRSLQVNARQTMPELRAEMLRTLRSEHSAQLELFLEYAFFTRVRVPERPFAANLIALLPADSDDESGVARGKRAEHLHAEAVAEAGAETGAERRAIEAPVWNRRGGQVLVLSGPLTAQRLVDDASLLVQLIDLLPSDVRSFEHDFIDFETPL